MPEFVNPPVTTHPTAFAGQVNPWHIDQTELFEQHKLTEGAGITVGIIDTGIDNEHATNGDFVDSLIEARDFTGSASGTDDPNRHGTHVAGLLCARVVKDRKFRGMCPKARFIMAKCLGDEGSGDSGDIADGVTWLADKGCNVINMSCGSPTPDDRIQAALEEYTSHGGIVCAAAGNDGGDLNWPARSPFAISYGAYDIHGTIAPFSCAGEQLDAAAPGVEIVSCGRRGGYAVLSGTSMAAPVGCGMVVLYLAWLKAKGLPMLNMSGVLHWIKRTSVDAGKPGYDPQFGDGIQTGASLYTLEPGTPTDPTTHPSWSGISIGPIHVPSKPGDFLSVDLGSMLPGERAAAIQQLTKGLA